MRGEGSLQRRQGWGWGRGFCLLLLEGMTAGLAEDCACLINDPMCRKWVLTMPLSRDWRYNQ